VHKIANRLVNRIEVRQAKSWKPTEREGSVDYHMNWYDVDIDKGSWTIMARTNNIVNKIEVNLRDNGYLYERFGKISLENEFIQFMNMWEELKKDKSLPLETIKQFYSYVPKQGKNQVVKIRVFRSTKQFML
jgi:hypothetical protein